MGVCKLSNEQADKKVFWIEKLFEKWVDTIDREHIIIPLIDMAYKGIKPARIFIESKLNYPKFVNCTIFVVFKNYLYFIYDPNSNFSLWYVDFLCKALDYSVKELNLLFKKDVESTEDKKAVKKYIGPIEETVLRIYFVLESKNRTFSSNRPTVPEENRKMIYQKIKPLLDKVIECSKRLEGNNKEKGIMYPSTALHFIQLLESVLPFDDAEYVILTALEVVKLAQKGGYNLDSIALRDTLSFIEVVLADHKSLLNDAEIFDAIIYILDVFADSGWTEALELLWNLNDAFE